MVKNIKQTKENIEIIKEEVHGVHKEMIINNMEHKSE